MHIASVNSTVDEFTRFWYFACRTDSGLAAGNPWSMKGLIEDLVWVPRPIPGVEVIAKDSILQSLLLIRASAPRSRDSSLDTLTLRPQILLKGFQSLKRSTKAATKRKFNRNLTLPKPFARLLAVQRAWDSLHPLSGLEFLRGYTEPSSLGISIK